MMRFLSLIVILLLAASPFGILAQSKRSDYRFVAKSDVIVDGDTQEWDALFSVDADSTWSFSVAKNPAYIYIAVEIMDPVLQVEAARSGILININPNGKKKDGMRLVFPLPDGESIRAMLSDEDLKPENVKQELIERSRGYYVKGFSMIVDGLLSFDNSYGIRAFAKMDDQNKLTYEAKIPIEQLKVRDRAQTIAVQVAINNRWTQMKQAMRHRSNTPMYRGRVMGSAPQVKAPFKGRTAVWIVDNL